MGVATRTRSNENAEPAHAHPWIPAQGRNDELRAVLVDHFHANDGWGTGMTVGSGNQASAKKRPRLNQPRSLPNLMPELTVRIYLDRATSLSRPKCRSIFLRVSSSSSSKI